MSDFQTIGFYQTGFTAACESFTTYASNCSTAACDPTITIGCGGTFSNQYVLTSAGTGCSPTQYIACNNSSTIVSVPLTPEQIAEQGEQRKKWLKDCAKAEKERRRVERVAARLLKRTVGERQYAAYRRLGYFELIGQTGRRYRIRLGQRVQVMAENFGDKVEYELCIVHTEQAPPTDRVITLILLLLSGEAGEQILHKTANRVAA